MNCFWNQRLLQQCSWLTAWWTIPINGMFTPMAYTSFRGNIYTIFTISEVTRLHDYWIHATVWRRKLRVPCICRVRCCELSSDQSSSRLEPAGSGWRRWRVLNSAVLYDKMHCNIQTNTLYSIYTGVPMVTLLAFRQRNTLYTNFYNSTAHVYFVCIFFFFFLEN